MQESTQEKRTRKRGGGRTGGLTARRKVFSALESQLDEFEVHQVFLVVRL